MLLARRRASRSSGEPGRTWAATSAMWIQTRAPSPSRWAETASSKSRAVAGSTVKVGSAVRSRRAPESRSAASAARPASTSSEAGSRGSRAARAASPRPRRAPAAARLRRSRGGRRPGAGRRSTFGPAREDAERPLLRLVDRGLRVVHDLDVGMDAVDLGQVDPVRGEVFADRQLQRAAVGEACSSWKTPLP